MSESATERELAEIAEALLGYAVRLSKIAGNIREIYQGLGRLETELKAEMQTDRLEEGSPHDAA
jgi:hypothetical protein